MAITRREFLQYSAATGAGVLFGVFDLKPIVTKAKHKLNYIIVFTTIEIKLIIFIINMN